MGQQALNIGWGGGEKSPVTIYTGPKLRPVLLMRTGHEFGHQKKVGKSEEREKNLLAFQYKLHVKHCYKSTAVT